MGKKLGATDDPLLVSVRSGAKFSMPGMMDTVLNLGLNDESVEGAREARPATRASPATATAASSRCSATSCWASTRTQFETSSKTIKKKAGSSMDTELRRGRPARQLIERLQGGRAEAQAARGFPQDPLEQLAHGARRRVPFLEQPARQSTTARMNGIPDDLGTAVNVQAMVFGNLGDDLRHRRRLHAQSRPPASNEFYGEYLINAQGEDVVAGIRTPQPIAELERVMPEALRELREITSRLEHHYRDVQDFEFTIQEGHLYMLQTRTGKRTGTGRGEDRRRHGG